MQLLRVFNKKTNTNTFNVETMNQLINEQSEKNSNARVKNAMFIAIKNISDSFSVLYPLHHKEISEYVIKLIKTIWDNNKNEYQKNKIMKIEEWRLWTSELVKAQLPLISIEEEYFKKYLLRHNTSLSNIKNELEFNAILESFNADFLPADAVALFLDYLTKYSDVLTESQWSHILPSIIMDLDSAYFSLEKCHQFLCGFKEDDLQKKIAFVKGLLSLQIKKEKVSTYFREDSVATLFFRAFSIYNIDTQNWLKYILSPLQKHSADFVKKKRLLVETEILTLILNSLKPDAEIKIPNQILNLLNFINKTIHERPENKPNANKELRNMPCRILIFKIVSATIIFPKKHGLQNAKYGSDLPNVTVQKKTPYLLLSKTLSMIFNSDDDAYLKFNGESKHIENLSPKKKFMEKTPTFDDIYDPSPKLISDFFLKNNAISENSAFKTKKETLLLRNTSMQNTSMEIENPSDSLYTRTNSLPISNEKKMNKKDFTALKALKNESGQKATNLLLRNAIVNTLHEIFNKSRSNSIEETDVDTSFKGTSLPPDEKDGKQEM